MTVPANFDPLLDVHFTPGNMGFVYGPQIFGPQPEFRRLQDIRASLRDPAANGPDPVYSIVMDVGRESDRTQLQQSWLLFGVVAYACGRLGDEPVRSQGHVHAVAPHCGWSTPELFEIWQGKAIIYAQEHVQDDPGRCIAIEAGPGDQVVVPPAWAHYVVNADPETPLVFGAWCDRQYGFVYDAVRAYRGLAWFPLLDENNQIHWERNPNYSQPSSIRISGCRPYPELGLRTDIPIYQQFLDDIESMQWVSDPGRFAKLWQDFEI